MTAFAWVERKDMRPGQMFVVRDPSIPLGLRDVMIVLNDKFEIGFWRGGIWAWGDITPCMEFEVIA
jgi:hypothetical protein